MKYTIGEIYIKFKNMKVNNIRNLQETGKLKIVEDELNLYKIIIYNIFKTHYITILNTERSDNVVYCGSNESKSRQGVDFTI